MKSSTPDYLKQGEAARLFPVLSTTSKEGRATSIFLACFSTVDVLGKKLLSSIKKGIGIRTKLEAYTEVVFHSGMVHLPDCRPDGLIIVRTGAKEWRALLETKIGKSELSGEQISHYQTLAKDNGVDCVITISNQFTVSPKYHPVEAVRKNKSRIPVYHWSWMHIRTIIDLLLHDRKIQDTERYMLTEYSRFLSHESTGVRGFSSMPPEWTTLNSLALAGGKIRQNSVEAISVLQAWHQETKDLSLILSRDTDTYVIEKLPVRHMKDPSQRFKHELEILCKNSLLSSTLSISNAAAPLEIVADLPRRTIDVGMTLSAPQDKVSPKARANWLLRQVQTEEVNDLYIRLNWANTSQSTTIPYSELSQNPGLADTHANGKKLRSFHIFYARRIGARFTQRSKFIAEFEKVVPDFYREIGQRLLAWRPKAPKIKDDNMDSSDGDAAPSKLQIKTPAYHDPDCK